MVLLILTVLVLLLSNTAKAEVLEFGGMCDGSAGIALDDTKFIVASDEENVIRVYDSQNGGVPLAVSENLSKLFKVDSSDEFDLEGASRFGDKIFFITSHGLTSKGKVKPERYQLFAVGVQLNRSSLSVQLIGGIFRGLKSKLIEDLRYKKYQFPKAAQIIPKDLGGLNIEGLSQDSSGKHLLIGFRNPIPDDKALIVPVNNPEEITKGKSLDLGEPIELKLSGMGIRDIQFWPPAQKYLVIAGPYNEEQSFALYTWSGVPEEPPQRLSQIDLTGMNPEAIVIFPNEDEKVLILSDDGTKKIGAKECKDTSETHRKFTGRWVIL